MAKITFTPNEPRIAQLIQCQCGEMVMFPKDLKQAMMDTRLGPEHRAICTVVVDGVETHSCLPGRGQLVF